MPLDNYQTNLGVSMMPGVVRLAPLKSTVCRLRGTPDPRRPLSSLARFDLAQRTGKICTSERAKSAPPHKTLSRVRRWHFYFSFQYVEYA